MRFILASSSPRRLQILRQIKIEPLVIPPQIEENLGDFSVQNIERNLEEITFRKLFSVYQKKFYNDLLIAADTIVIKDDQLFGKPVSPEEARKMLNKLSATDHLVKTGVAILFKGESDFFIETSRVFFSEISDDELEFYLQNENYQDKAGAYAIQGMAAAFIQRVEGCFFNVMGFPLNAFYKLLRHKKIPVWDYVSEGKHD